jgi:peptide chain release factor 1
MSDQPHPSLLAKLDEIDGRYDAIAEQMSAAAASGNSAQIVKLAKEHAQLGRLAEPYRTYKKVVSNVSDNQALMADPAADSELRELAETELPELEIKARRILDGLIDDLLAGDDANVDSVIVEIRAGTGGDEAALFARDLYDMYTRYAESHGLKLEVMDMSASDLGGFREVILSVRGPGVYTHLGYEGGGHRVQRVPETETQGRIHTSAATVAVLPEMEETEVDIDWDKDVLEHVSAAGGPGGQNVNKVASAIKLEHKATGITVSMRDERSQHKNRAKARRLMASRVKSFYDEQERAKRDSTRRTMIGSGDRNERIRTYNFPQNRCTDHRVNESYSLEKVVAGNLDELIGALRRHDREQRLKAL